MLSGQDLPLDATSAEFTARIVEPMLARLQRGFEPRPNTRYVHLRISVYDMTEEEFGLLCAVTSDD